VGHEIDVTLADLVADRRALTPTEAGELLVPDEREWLQQLDTAQQHLRRLLRARYDRAHEQWQVLARSRVFRDPYLPLREQERLLDELQQRASRAIRHRWERGRAELAQCAGQLETLSPLGVLSRGYSLTQRADGQVVKRTSDVAVGEQIKIRVSDGSVHAEVIESRIQKSKRS
jgi:exodeoxyribonuclease VII large subunit